MEHAEARLQPHSLAPVLLGGMDGQMSEFLPLLLKPTGNRHSVHEQVEYGLAIPFLPAHLQACLLNGERTPVFLRPQFSRNDKDFSL